MNEKYFEIKAELNAPSYNNLIRFYAAYSVGFSKSILKKKAGLKEFMKNGSLGKSVSFICEESEVENLKRSLKRNLSIFMICEKCTVSVTEFISTGIDVSGLINEQSELFKEFAEKLDKAMIANQEVTM